jgi:hypothetical protein
VEIGDNENNRTYFSSSSNDNLVNFKGNARPEKVVRIMILLKSLPLKINFHQQNLKPLERISAEYAIAASGGSSLCDITK